MNIDPQNLFTYPVPVSGSLANSVLPSSSNISYGGPAEIDSDIMLWLVAGIGFTSIKGLTAAVNGGSQTGATLIPMGYTLVSVDTSTASATDSLMLPACIAGHKFTIYNNTANTILIYAWNGYNKATALVGTDKIKNSANSASFTLATHKAVTFFSATNGQWASNLSN